MLQTVLFLLVTTAKIYFIQNMKLLALGQFAQQKLLILPT